MIYISDYKNCKVIIRNEATGEFVGETSVLEYDKRHFSIFVDAKQFVHKIRNERLLLLIFTGDAIHSFGGVARREIITRGLEISIFNGKEYDDRGAKRYQVNVSAKISEVLGQGRCQGVTVKVINLSTQGALIESDELSLDRGSVFVLNLNVSGSLTNIKCEVVRVLRKGENKTQNYGCKFLNSL